MLDSTEIATRVRQSLIRALSLELEEEELRYVERLDEALAIDSLAILQFVVELEREFGIVIDPESLSLPVFLNQGRLVELIMTRLGSPAEPGRSGV